MLIQPNPIDEYLVLAEGVNSIFDIPVYDQDGNAPDLTLGGPFTGELILREKIGDDLVYELDNANITYIAPSTNNGNNVRLSFSGSGVNGTANMLGSSIRIGGTVYLLGDLIISDDGDPTYRSRIKIQFDQSTSDF